MTSSEFRGAPTHLSNEPTSAESQAERPAEGIHFYATRWCGDCWRSKRVFEELGVDYTYVDIEQDDGAARLVRTLNRGMRSVPTIVFPDGAVLTEPSNRELEAKLRSLVG
jgi:mycoredoxin